jgi:hypothetical protein
MGTEEGMGKAPASSVGSDDVLQVESKWSYLLRCETRNSEITTCTERGLGDSGEKGETR